MGASDITMAKMAETNGVFDFEAQSTDYGVMMSKNLKGCRRQPWVANKTKIKWRSIRQLSSQ